MKFIRGLLKQFVPYGLMCVWLRRHYGIVEDVPLLFYPGFFKRVRRVVKFSLPYGLVKRFKAKRYQVSEGFKLGVEAQQEQAVLDAAWQVWQQRPGASSDRVVVHSPMPPEQSGIANFSLKLHMAEPEKWDVFAADMTKDAYEQNRQAHGPGYNVMPSCFFRKCLGPVGYGRPAIFVIGNNDRFHYNAVAEAVRSKGVVDRWLYLHEAMVQDAMIGYMARQGVSLADYLHRWYPQVRLDESRLNSPDRDQYMQDTHMLGVRALVELSGIDNIIVNNVRCRELVLADLTEEQRRRVRLEMMFLPIEKIDVGEKVDFAQGGCKVVGTFGTPHEFKGTVRVVEAIARLNRQGYGCRLLLAGYHDKWYLENRVPEEFRPYCIVPEDTSDLDYFKRLMGSVDLAVQLRIVQHGESSGCVNELLGVGTPVLTNRGFVNADVERFCHCTSADPSVDELTAAIRGALESRERKALTDELFAQHSFQAASQRLYALVRPAKALAPKRRRFFVDATCFDGHGIARSTDFLYLALRRELPDAEVVYLCNRAGAYRSNAPHRFIMVDCAHRDEELVRILAEEQPECVHFPFNGQLPEGIDGVRAKTRVISTIHDLIPLRIPEVLGMSQECVQTIERQTRFALEHSDVVFCDSEFTIRDIRELMQVKGDNLTCLYFAPMLSAEGGVAPNRFGSRPFFLYNGGYCPRKGIGALVRNFMALRERGELSCDLWMTSHPNERAVGDVELFRRGVAKGWIRELGYVSDEELRTLFHEAIAMVYPSSYEGFGLPPLEAMNAGCPSLVARTSSLPEVCGEAVLWLENRDDDAEFQSALRRLTTDSKLRKRLIARGREQAAKFTWEKTVRTFLASVRPCRG